MQQLIHKDPAQKSGSAKKETLIKGKVQAQPHQRVSASELAMQLGMEFPSNGLPVVMDEQEGPVAVHAEDLVSASSCFLTDYSGQMVTVQPMMGG